MSTALVTATTPTKEEISYLASRLWEKAGRPDGRDLEFWLNAEKQLLAARAPGAMSRIHPVNVPKPVKKRAKA